MDWVQVIGYQHEVMHTGVLRHLLTGDRAPEVAAALLGDVAVAAVEDVGTEQRLAGSRPIDLAAWLIGDDGVRIRLAVETKVDSAWSPEQLSETAGTDCEGVLLAVGYTALAATERDLAALSEHTGSRWRLLGPRAWGAIVRDFAADDAELARYARRVLDEAAEQAEAVESVVAGREVTAGRDPDSLAHWAYFHEVIRDRADAADWVRTTLRSGPLLTRWVKWHSGDRGDYLEFMGNGARRSLCVKTFAPAGALAASRERLRDLLGDGDGAEEPKRPGARSKTCTVARWWLDGRSPQDASSLASELQVLLDAQPTL